MNKCCYCEKETNNILTEEPTVQVGRFVNGELRLLHKGDCVCYDCLVLRIPVGVKSE